MPKVYNRRHNDAPDDAVYVGRGSKWGNPYRIGPKYEREDVIEQFELYLLNNKELMEQLPELRGKDLVCWCAPEACHADVLMEYANNEELTMADDDNIPEAIIPRVDGQGRPKCKGFTKKGRPCKRTDVKENGFCDAHQTQDNTTGALARSWKEQSEDTKEYVRNAFRGAREAMSLEEYDEQFWTELEEEYDFIFSVTGSRSLQLADDKHKLEVMGFMRGEMRRLKEKYGKVLLITGMAEGFDALCARAAQLEGVHYVATIPSPTYGEYYWRDHSVTGNDRYGHYLAYLADEHCVAQVHVCDDYRGHPPKRAGKANFDRNQYMVDRASAFYVYNKTSRGTRDCLTRIKKAEKPRIILDNHMEIPS